MRKYLREQISGRWLAIAAVSFIVGFLALNN